MLDRVDNERDQRSGLPPGESQYWDDSGKQMMAQLNALRHGHRRN